MRSLRTLRWLLLATAMMFMVGCGSTRVVAPVVAAEVPRMAAAAAVVAPAAAAAVAADPPAASLQAGPRKVDGRFLVALDPGHGGDEIGAAANGVVERDSNLDMAERVAGFLSAHDVDVLLTREDAGRAPGTASGSGFNVTRSDLQARVKAANAAGAAVFVSLHSNGSPDTSQRGVEVYYDSRREFADDNRRLARAVLDGALQGLSDAGYPSRDRGIIDAACWRNNNGRCVGLFVLSPGGNGKEATAMPAALAELLFISNYGDASLLREPTVRDTIAEGVANGILRYLGVAG